MSIGTGKEFQASRYCGGDATNGAQWEMAYVASCNFTDSARSICQIASVRLLNFGAHGMNLFFLVSASLFRSAFLTLFFVFVSHCKHTFIH